jgi:hypothetical protein
MEAIHGARRGKEKVPRAVVAAALQYHQEALQVAFCIAERVGERIAHTRLGCQVDDDVELLAAKERVQPLPVPEIGTQKSTIFIDGALHGGTFPGRGDAQFPEAGVLERLVIIGIEVVEAHDSSPGCQETGRDMKADKARGAGDKYLFSVHDSDLPGERMLYRTILGGTATLLAKRKRNPSKKNEKGRVTPAQEAAGYGR